MFAALVAFIGDMPLKSEILIHPILPPFLFLLYVPTYRMLHKHFRKLPVSPPAYRMLRKHFRKLPVSPPACPMLRKLYHKLHLPVFCHPILQCLIMPFVLPPSCDLNKYVGFRLLRNYLTMDCPKRKVRTFLLPSYF
jgi:hypothetical protein